MSARTCVLLLLLGGMLRGQESVDLRMLNGDHFQGGWMGFEGGALLLVPPWSGAAPLRIPARNIARMERGEAETVSGQAFPQELWLAGGDRLPVAVLGGDSGEIQVRTPWGDEHRLDQALVRQIHPRPPPGKRVLAGPMDLSEWTVQPELSRMATRLRPRMIPGVGIRMMPGVMMQRAYENDPGDRFVLTMEVAAGKGRDLAFMVLPCESQGQKGGTRLQLQVNSRAGILWVRHGGRSTALRFPSQESGDYRFRFWVDLAGRTVAMDLNDVRYGTVEFNDQLSLEGPGKGIHFTVHSEAVLMKEMRVDTWNGDPPSLEPPSRLEPGEAHLILYDEAPRDIVWRGAVAEGVRMEGGEVLPWGKIDRVVFATDGEMVPRRRHRDVRVELGQPGSRLTLEWLRLENGMLHGQPDGWMGSVRLPVSMLRAVEFNPHLPRSRVRDAAPEGGFRAYTHGVQAR